MNHPALCEPILSISLSFFCILPPSCWLLRNQLPVSRLTRRGWCFASGALQVWKAAGRLGSPPAGRRPEAAWCSGSLWPGWVAGSGWGGTPAGKDEGLCPRPGTRNVFITQLYWVITVIINYFIWRHHSPSSWSACGRWQEQTRWKAKWSLYWAFLRTLPGTL